MTVLVDIHHQEAAEAVARIALTIPSRPMTTGEQLALIWRAVQAGADIGYQQGLDDAERVAISARTSDSADRYFSDLRRIGAL